MDKTSYKEAYETHGIFVDRQSQGNIIELIYRVKSDNNTSILCEDILNRFKLIDNNIRKNNIIANFDNKCHIYINYIDSNKKQIGHFSLHIEPENKQLNYYTRKVGRFHFKNNSKNKYYTVRFNTQNNTQNYIVN